MSPNLAIFSTFHHKFSLKSITLGPLYTLSCFFFRFPVMLKAVRGGGGKVWSKTDVLIIIALFELLQMPLFSHCPKSLAMIWFWYRANKSCVGKHRFKTILGKRYMLLKTKVLYLYIDLSFTSICICQKGIVTEQMVSAN